MIKLTTNIPPNVYIAFSGGADSRFALDFVRRSRARRVKCIHINHGTEFSNLCEEFCVGVANGIGLQIEVVRIGRPPEKMSKEAFWHEERYRVFQSLDHPVITGHNLDDAVEWWLMRAMLGRQPTLLSPKNMNVLRPFLRFSKKDILSRLGHHDYIEDPTNLDGNLRGKIRNRIVNEVDELTSIRSIIRRKYDACD